MTQVWSFGGTDLTTFGTITLLDNAFDFVESRGDDKEIPLRNGRVFNRKYFDQRVISFGMVVTSTTAAGLQTKLDTLRALIAKRTQQTLSYTLDDGTIRTAPASVNKALDLTREAPLIMRGVLEFTLPFPFMRLSTVIADNTTTINASPKAMSVTNPGTVEERDPTILLTGPLSNVTITNSTTSCSVTYTGTIDAGHTVTIATTSGEYTAVHSVSGNVIGNVTHSGSSALLTLDPGSNTLSVVSGTTTTGTVKISFYAPFL